MSVNTLILPEQVLWKNNFERSLLDFLFNYIV